MSDPLDQVWDQYHHRLKAFIRNRVEDDAAAEDLLQESFIRVHRHLCCQPDWNKPDGWFYQIACNLIIDHYRRRRELVELSDTWPADPDVPEDDPAAEWALSLKDMIDELPEPYRQALLLTEYQGLSQVTTQPPSLRAFSPSVPPTRSVGQGMRSNLLASQRIWRAVLEIASSHALSAKRGRARLATMWRQRSPAPRLWRGRNDG